MDDFTFPVSFESYLNSVRPQHYHRDGKPIVDSPEGVPAWEQWALMFEDTKSRTIGSNRTLYGERLSTVWLGLDHGFGGGPPLIFETMLFAPYKNGKRLRIELTPEERDELDRDRAYVEKHYPHDQLQQRYATEREAYDTHEKLFMQCIVPPRWRRFILGVLGGDTLWLRWDEEREDAWL